MSAVSENYIESIPFDDLVVGQSATITRMLTPEAIILFAAMSGDVNPAHMDETYARNSMFHGVIGHGMWTGALVSTVLGTILPGPGTIYLGQALHFRKPVRIGDELTITVTVASKGTDKPVVVLDCIADNQKGERVLDGQATVMAPTEKIRIPRPEQPEAQIQAHRLDHFLRAACVGLPMLRLGVVHPVTAESLLAVAEASAEQQIKPVLFGPKQRILAAADSAGISLGQWQVIDTPHSHAAAAEAVSWARDHRVDALMKGALHSDELLAAIMERDSGLRCERRMSHVYLMDVPAYHKPLMITDAAINIAPDLLAKAEICQNAIDLWAVLFGNDGAHKPKVAVVAAVETVNAKMAATVDAAALSKMAERGQIRDADLDGPLALDNAISINAAREKGIISTVAGDADILLVPTIEAGNMVAKQLTFLGNADAAGIVLGARVPVILTSRADDRRTRLMSCALARLLVQGRQTGKIK